MSQTSAGLGLLSLIAQKSRILSIFLDRIECGLLMSISHAQKRTAKMAVYGYARVSTTGQTLAAQDAELTKAGAGKVYRETASGAKTDRPQLAKLLKRLEPGDTLLVTRLDRLARSTRDLLNVLDQVARVGATFKSLADAWADTTAPHGRLIVTVLDGLAEFERELILART